MILKHNQIRLQVNVKIFYPPKKTVLLGVGAEIYLDTSTILWDELNNQVNTIDIADNLEETLS